MPASHLPMLPIRLRRPRRRAAWRVLQVLSLVGFCFFALVYVDENRPDLAIMLAGLGLGGVMLIELLLRVRDRWRDLGVTIDADGVHRDDGKERWDEPLSAYDGVLWREEFRTRGSGRNRRRVRYTIIELPHRLSAARGVALLEQDSEKGVRAYWEGVAGALGLPALRQLPGGGTLRREVADLDKSLRQLAREGRRELPAEDLPAPPADVDWRADDALWARVRPEPTFRLFALAAGIIVSGIAVIVALVNWTPWPLLLAPAGVLGHYLRRDGHYEVGQAEGRLWIGMKLGEWVVRHRSFPVDEIEQIWTGSASGLGFAHREVRAVTVESDARTVRVLPLSPDAAAWLHHFVYNLVVDAPE